MRLWNDPLQQGLEHKLDVSSLRQKVTAQNISNLNTPGYKRAYVDFDQELSRAGVPLARTNEAHRPAKGDAGAAQVKREVHTSRRPDGNNVDLDDEMMNMVTNQLRYNSVVQQVSDRYARWRYVINEGRR